MAYLDLELFKPRTVMPSDHVDEVEAVQPGFWAAQFEMVSRKIDARLRKRYAVPFAAGSVPEAVMMWATQIVTLRGYMRRGSDPSDPLFDLYKSDHDDAWKELTEAAESAEGLFDLPLIDAEDSSAIAKQSTAGYSEHSPYVGFDRQAAIGREEDSSGGGTFT